MLTTAPDVSKAPGVPGVIYGLKVISGPGNADRPRSGRAAALEAASTLSTSADVLARWAGRHSETKFRTKLIPTERFTAEMDEESYSRVAWRPRNLNGHSFGCSRESAPARVARVVSRA